MANPQLVQGGAAVSVPTPAGGALSGSSAPGTYYIYSPGGSLLGTGAETATTTIAGLTVAPTGSTTPDNGGGTVRTYTLAASSSATAGTGFKFGVYPASSGGPVYGAFDVVAGSGGTALSPVSFTDALFSDGLLTSGVSRAPSTFSDAFFSDSFTRPGLTHAPKLFTDALFSDSLTATSSQQGKGVFTFTDRLLSETLVAGPRNGARQSFSDALLADTFAPQPVTHPPALFTDAFFSDTFSSGPRTYGPQKFADFLVTDAGGRTGQISSGGGTSPAFSFADAFLLDGILAGPRRGGPRTFTDGLLLDSAARTGYSRRLSLADALLSDSATYFRVSPAPLPGAVDNRDPFVVLNAELAFLFSLLQGNPMSTNSTTLAILDKLAASYRINELSLLANTVAQLPTLIRGGDGVTSTVYGYGSDAPILTLLPAADALIAQSAPNVVLAGIYRGFMAALRTFVSKAGYPSLDAYLTALNTPSPYQALIHPNAALINWLFNNQEGTLLLSPGNVFAPPVTFGTASVGASAGSLAFTHLSDIPAANVVSSTAGQSTQGYAAAPGAAASITAGINGTLTATLKAAGQNAAGQAVTGRTWTAVLDNAAAGATVAFVPAVAGDRIYGVVSCTGSGTATGGGFTLTSVIERVVS